jgi:K+-transporting ATPase ATPase C chain
MKTHLFPALRLTLVMLVLLAVMYPLLVAGISRLAPGGGQGETVVVNGNVVGYARIGQAFTEDRYFNSRPSAVAYNAAVRRGPTKARVIRTI